MSLHAQMSPEALAKLQAQQRNSTISSLIISILLILLIGIILLWILLPPIDNYTPEIVSYQAGKSDEKELRKPRMQNQVKRKPSSPSSSMAKVIASNSVSNIAIPVSEQVVAIESLDFGNGDDMGDGWGSGSGWGSGGGTSFFGQTVKGQRILYIIDFSASMKGARQKLMRKELADSVQHLPPDRQYQMVFFAGPAWVAGDKVKMNGKQSAVIVSGDDKYPWKGGGKAHAWKPNGTKQNPGWVYATDKQVETSQKIIKNHKLIWGTNWMNPLQMAFRMDPLPESIVFMTDGLAGGNPVEIANDFAARAKKNGIIINTVALMEPKAAEAMELLAKKTGGHFALIGADGKKVKR